MLEEDSDGGYEAEEDEEVDACEGEEEEEAKESAKMKVLRLVALVASKVKEIIGNLITTAGKVVVTILLGMTGEASFSRQSCSAQSIMCAFFVVFFSI